MLESRRDFIKWLMVSSLAPSILANATPSENEDLVVILNYPGEKFWLFDWAKYHLTEFSLPLGPLHSALQLSAHEVLFFEYWGHSMLRFNLKTGEKYRVKLDENSYFSGHGLLSQDGQYLFTVEQGAILHQPKALSRLVVRDAKTLQALDVVHSSMTQTIHELLPGPNNQILFSLGSMVQPIEMKICFLDWKSGSAKSEIAKEVTLPGVHATAAHFLALKDGRFLVFPVMQSLASREAVEKIVAQEKSILDRIHQFYQLVKLEPSPMFIISPDGSVEKLWPENEGQEFLRSLSGCIMPCSQGDLFAVTHPAGHNVTVWNGDRLVKQIGFGREMPTGIAYSKQKKEMLVTDLSNGRLRFFSVPDLKEKTGREMAVNGTSAAHVLHLR